MKRLLHEPLLHFLLGGALLFVLYGMVGRDSARAPDRVVIGEQQVLNLAATFERTWLRAPTPDELDQIVQDFVDEEILYREGLALGLDRDDLVVRRRLRQKVEFLYLDLGEQREPTEAELSTYLSANRERFQDPARISFQQRFVSPDEGSPAARRRAEEVLSRLHAGEDAEGDATLLPGTLTKASEREVAAAFGADFAADLFASTGDAWIGPIASSYGLHLVRVEERIPARRPALEQIRRAVEIEYEAAQRAEARQRFLQELRGRYEVETHMPGVDSTARVASVGG